MHKIVTSAAVGLSLAAASVAAASAASGGGRDASVTVLRTEFKLASRAFQDLDQSKTPTPGDNVVQTSDIFSEGRRIGYDVGTCTIVRPTERSAVWNCWATVSLPGGEIVVQGLFDGDRGPAGPHRYAILGGTGAYRKARGQVVYRVAPDTQSGTSTARIIRR